MCKCNVWYINLLQIGLNLMFGLKIFCTVYCGKAVNIHILRILKSD